MLDAARQALIALLVLSLGSSLACGRGKTDGEAAGASDPVPVVGQPVSASPGGVEPAAPGAAEKAAAPEPAGSAVAARVNGTNITYAEVAELVEQRVEQLRAQGANVPDEAYPQLRRGALQMLIDAELMVQAARAQGIKPDLATVDKMMQSARQNFPDEEAFQKFLTEMKMTEAEARADAERGVMIQAYMKQATGAATAPSDAEMRKYYDENRQVFRYEEQIRLAYLLIPVPEGATPEQKAEARRKADAFHRRADAGEEFFQLIQEAMQPEIGGRGSDLGVVGRGQLSPHLEPVVFTTAAGKVAPVLEDQPGLVIFKVLERQEPRQATFDEAKGAIQQELTRRRSMEAFEAKLADLRAKARVEVLIPELVPPPTE